MLPVTRYFVFRMVLLLTVLAVIGGYYVHPLIYRALYVLLPLAALGIYDRVQTRHAILRNYPLMGHFRFLFESIRVEIRQYFIEDDQAPVPYSREQRALVYQRSKNETDKLPFGTIKDVNAIGYGWLSHSLKPVANLDHDFRLTIGGKDCQKPYSASIFNISGMSFGAISANAVLALSKGAKTGSFAQNTGEGSISPYHRQGGGDLIWQVASGYFGCRTADGRFDPEAFTRQAADPQVKMIEIKLSQGAKPGHGGILPKAKITPEIAATRLISRDHDCESPAAHPEFSTPRETIQFIARLRELSGGKPVGLKLAIGHRSEFLSLVKAMLALNTTPDFIVVDGGEGGTGAAPLELSNNVGLPLIEGLSYVHNALLGAGLRQEVRVGASGKIVSAFDICRIMALGADYVMAARPFMFSVGCIQARACHTNKCPTGVTTQDKKRQSALVVEDKYIRVANYHRNTMKALAEMLGTAGIKHPGDVRPWHLHIRANTGEIIRGDVAYPRVKDGALIDGTANEALMREWHRAQIDSYDQMDESIVKAVTTPA